jgi:hypothetical protein
VIRPISQMYPSIESSRVKPLFLQYFIHRSIGCPECEGHADMMQRFGVKFRMNLKICSCYTKISHVEVFLCFNRFTFIEDPDLCAIIYVAVGALRRKSTQW